jgi:hypothetical protein
MGGSLGGELPIPVRDGPCGLDLSGGNTGRNYVQGYLAHATRPTLEPYSRTTPKALR